MEPRARDVIGILIFITALVVPMILLVVASLP
jgi:hypothetical protein